MENEQCVRDQVLSLEGGNWLQNKCYGTEGSKSCGKKTLIVAVCVPKYYDPAQNSLFPWFLNAFAKFRKATISSVMSVRPPVCLSVCLSVRKEQFSSHWTDLGEN